MYLILYQVRDQMVLLTESTGIMELIPRETISLLIYHDMDVCGLISFLHARLIQIHLLDVLCR